MPGSCGRAFLFSLCGASLLAAAPFCLPVPTASASRCWRVTRGCSCPLMHLLFFPSTTQLYRASSPVVKRRISPLRYTQGRMTQALALCSKPVKIHFRTSPAIVKSHCPIGPSAPRVSTVPAASAVACGERWHSERLTDPFASADLVSSF